MKKHRWRRNIFYRGYMRCKALFANIVFGFPSRGMICVGVTGTDGKSTTSEMIYRILKKVGYKVGLLSTVHIDVGDGEQDNLTKLTSLSHRDFCKYLKKAKNNGLQYMVLEVSSHALYQLRVRPVKFKAVGFTNLSREHLDFHRTMDHYFKTKISLFTKQSKKTAVGVYPASLSSEQQTYIKTHFRGQQLYRFGIGDDSTIWASDFKEHPYLSVTLHYQQQDLVFNTKLLGSFNAENMMIATVLTHTLGVSFEDIVGSLNTFPGLPGRQELIIGNNGITAMIDFALTPDALRTLYTAVRRMGYKRLIAVFGATGDRDQGKRPLMGKVATELCDYVVLTEDENYSEDGKTIIHQIEQGIGPAYRDKYCVIQDRTMAIEHALSYATSGDIVIVTGMANFTTRAMNAGKISWNEKAVIQKAFEKKGASVKK